MTLADQFSPVNDIQRKTLLLRTASDLTSDNISLICQKLSANFSEIFSLRIAANSPSKVTSKPRTASAVD